MTRTRAWCDVCLLEMPQSGGYTCGPVNNSHVCAACYSKWSEITSQLFHAKKADEQALRDRWKSAELTAWGTYCDEVQSRGKEK